MSLSAARRYGSAYLFGRRHSAPRKAPPIDLLPPDVEALFVRCFEAGLTNPSARPGAAEWIGALDRASRNLAECPDNLQHRYSSHRKTCVWCEHRSRVGFDPFPVPGTGVTDAAPNRPQKLLSPPCPTASRPHPGRCSATCSCPPSRASRGAGRQFPTSFPVRSLPSVCRRPLKRSNRAGG